MEGGWRLLLLSGVLCGLAGCESLRGGKAAPSPNATAEPPLSSNSGKSSPSADDDHSPPKVTTLLAFADLRLQASYMPNRSERDRDGDLKEARDKYQMVLQREPKNIAAMLGMARTYRAIQEKDKCVEWYQKAAKTDAKNAGIWCEMAQALDSMGDREAAIYCYHTASKMDPDNREFKKSLGFALARMGRYDEAFNWLCRAMTPASAHIALARMLDHNGQHDLANQQFTLALKLDPNNEMARMALSNTPHPSDALAQASYEQYVPPTNNAPAPAAAPLPPIMSMPGRDQNPSPPAVIRAPDPLPLTLPQR